METPTTILPKIRRYFPEPVFEIAHDPTKQQYIITRDMVTTNKKTRITEEKTIHCLEFGIEGDRELVIKLILNCSIDLEFLGRGKDLVERIVRFSKSMGYTTKIEYDVSKISVHGIEFSLRKFRLLATGQTWYQSLGFQEANYDKNRACIAMFIDNRPRNLGNLTIREHYAQKMREIQEFSKREVITEGELSDLRKFSANIDRKFRDLEKACPSTHENFHDLVYKTAKSPTSPPPPTTSSRSASSSRKTKKQRTSNQVGGTL